MHLLGVHVQAVPSWLPRWSQEEAVAVKPRPLHDDLRERSSSHPEQGDGKLRAGPESCRDSPRQYVLLQPCACPFPFSYRTSACSQVTQLVCKKLYGDCKPTTSHAASGVDRAPASAEDLNTLLTTFQWGSKRPSDFFLRVLFDALHCLDADPLGGNISPPLIGSYGSIPLTVIAPLADIFRHM